MMINTIQKYNNYNTKNLYNSKPNLNSKQNQNINFKGAEVEKGAGLLTKIVLPLNRKYKKVFNPVVEKLAEWIGQLAGSKAMKKYTDLIQKHPKIEKNLFSHLIVLGSTLLSGFYVAKTIKNNNMDKDKRRTLAINQAATFIASTVMAYTLDNWSQKHFKTFIKKYETINAKDPNIAQLSKGLKIAKATITIDMVYRFLAPVAVTPIANHIGNKIIENNKKTKEQKQLNKTA